MRMRRRKTVGTRLHRVYFWLWDGMYDRLDLDGPDWPFNVLDAIVERPAKWLLCKVYGHDVADDHCGKPEHRMCPWCNRSMANLPATPSR